MCSLNGFIEHKKEQRGGDFGKKLEKILWARGISQGELADLVNQSHHEGSIVTISQQTVSKIIQGREPKHGMILRIAIALKIGVEELF